MWSAAVWALCRAGTRQELGSAVPPACLVLGGLPGAFICTGVLGKDPPTTGLELFDGHHQENSV